MKNRLAFHSALALLAFGSLAALAAPIYSNGPLSTGATSLSGVSAPAGTTWSEAAADSPTSANTNSGYTASGSFRLADNFVVPVGQTFNISSIDFFAYVTGSSAASSPFTALTLQIWLGRPGDPGSSVLSGDTTTNVLSSSTFSNMYRIFNSTTPAPGNPPGTTRPIFQNNVATPGLTLTEGEYWLDFALATGSSNVFYPAVTIPGVRTLSGWNARQLSGSTWADIIDGGNPAESPDVAQDLNFILNGTDGGASVPEPSTVVLAGAGLLVAGLARRRKMR